MSHVPINVNNKDTDTSHESHSLVNISHESQVPNLKVETPHNNQSQYSHEDDPKIHNISHEEEISEEERENRRLETTRLYLVNKFSYPRVLSGNQGYLL